MQHIKHKKNVWVGHAAISESDGRRFVHGLAVFDDGMQTWYAFEGCVVRNSADAFENGESYATLLNRNKQLPHKLKDSLKELPKNVRLLQDAEIDAGYRARSEFVKDLTNPKKAMEILEKISRNKDRQDLEHEM